MAFSKPRSSAAKNSLIRPASVIGCGILRKSSPYDLPPDRWGEEDDGRLLDVDVLLSVDVRA